MSKATDPDIQPTWTLWSTSWTSKNWRKTKEAYYVWFCHISKIKNTTYGAFVLSVVQLNYTMNPEICNKLKERVRGNLRLNFDKLLKIIYHWAIKVTEVGNGSRHTSSGLRSVKYLGWWIRRPSCYFHLKRIAQKAIRFLIRQGRTNEWYCSTFFTITFNYLYELWKYNSFN